ncbi:hypothetical protein POSPLADRAFT_1181435 [Postia placenta MAD-698-R-SB12]|uniref:Pex19-domain-containing protein n=1 Tax=Postia placenta MAD-698-R-SB12 TaxID=670580 RepID=A0A1X6N1H8_9APHY|nr:hypothetical protein POSPLADRAFT_1181435 [Postia placenta MAD-698-R-SB12]OSX62316.1 hypothetical protein POSPLADRAFT_1181435 [Postia placenta MAD-698-R-SB12]
MSDPRKARVDDEDLDDLDDVLDQFSAPPAKSQAPPISAPQTSSAENPAPTASASLPSSKSDPLGLGGLALTDDFASELTRGMESLMREIMGEAGLDPKAGASSSTGDGEPSEEEIKREEAFRAAWEKMLVEGMNGALDVEELSGGTSGKEKERGTESTSGAATSSVDPQDNFQTTIKKALDKLKESDANLQADSPESFEAMMAKLAEGSHGGESDEEAAKLIEGIMSQLMTKEILYEPLKELHAKFPGYLKDHAATISADDKKSYDAQYAVLEKIIATFDDPAYSDSSTNNDEIVTLMTEMQSHGSPPAALMGPLPPGLDFGPDGIPQLPEGCVIG